MQANVILCTAPHDEQARQIAHALVEERLAACVTILPGARSIYRWQGEVCDDAELLLIIKARHEDFPRLMRRLQELHPYEVPEILALAVADASPAYLDWLQGATEAL